MPKIEGLNILVNNFLKSDNFKYASIHCCRMRRDKIRTKAEFVRELKKLEFWYLYGIPPRIKNSKIIFRGPDYIRKILSVLRDAKLWKEFHNFEEELNNYKGGDKITSN